MSKYENTHQQQELLSRAEDLVRSAAKGKMPRFTHFLNGEEAAFLENWLHSKRTGFCFSGGFLEAERKMAAVFPDFYEPDAIEFPITLLKIELKTGAQLTHRDYLGAVLNLGIERSRVGDILCFPGYGVIAAERELVGHIERELSRVGRESVKAVTVGDFSGLFAEHEFEEIKNTVSSPRLDCVVKVLIGKARGTAADLIRAELVSVNHRIVSAADREVLENDLISIKGYGRFRVDEIGPQTRSGRLFFQGRKYV